MDKFLVYIFICTIEFTCGYACGRRYSKSKKKEIAKTKEIATEKLRKVQSFKNGKWIDIVFEDIKKGDIYRMNEPNGQPVTYQGKSVLIALGDVCFDKELNTEAIKTNAYEGKLINE